MLWNVNDVVGFGIRATDGTIGSVRDLLFDDHSSAVRYLVVDTGEWLPGRKVLLTPEVVDEPDVVARAFPVRLSREQVKHSPDVASDPPVSRQEEARLHEHYGWSPYWATPGAVGTAPYWGAAGFGYMLPPATGPVEREYPAPRTAGPDVAPAPGRREEAYAASRAAEAQLERGEPSLRSAREVIGYYIEAKDGDIGHVEDLLVQDDSWTIRYVVVDTRNWLPGRKVIVSPQWLSWIDWGTRKVGLDLDRERVRSSPEWDPATTLDRAYEEALHRHYDRPAYW